MTGQLSVSAGRVTDEGRRLLVTIEPDTSSPQVIVCGGHPEVRFAMATALLAHDLPTVSCESAEVPERWEGRTSALVVVLSRDAEDIDLIERATARGLRVVAVHGPSDVRGAAAARRAGASLLLPRTGRIAPLVDAVQALVRGASPASGSSVVSVGALPDQPLPEELRAVRSPQ